MKRDKGGLHHVLSDLCGQSWQMMVRHLEVPFGGKKKKRKSWKSGNPSRHSKLGLCLVYYRDEGALENLQVCTGHLADTEELHSICRCFGERFNQPCYQHSAQIFFTLTLCPWQHQLFLLRNSQRRLTQMCTLSAHGSVSAPGLGQEPSLLPSPCLLGHRERHDLLRQPGAVLRVSLFRSLARSHLRV